jgi:hypothetical protein
MKDFAIGAVVKTLDNVFGWVRTEPVDGVVRVELLPMHAHITETGWASITVDDLTEVRVCGCALLGYRDASGQVVRTDCDALREPGRNSVFLPGHDAKAKGFLIRAWGEGAMFGGHEHSLAAARQFGDKITAKVAAGVGRSSRETNRSYLQSKANEVTRHESPATKAVMRNLQRGKPETGHEPIGYSFVGRDTTLETFTADAKAWLGDKTELKSSTIDGADYSVAFDYFRGE